MIIKHDISLKPLNSFGIEANAKTFSSFTTVEELEEILSELPGASPIILGGGSNILITGDLDRPVLKNEVSGMNRTSEDEDYAVVKVGAGENWHGFVNYCIENGLGGVENLSLIPGNIGASPMQNIGAYGVEIKDVFDHLNAFHIYDKKMVRFNVSDCHFGYRESVFKKQYKDHFSIIDVSFRLRKKPVFNISYGAIQQELETQGVKELSIRAISDAIISIRQSKLPDPKKIGNAGSFFKNPEISASAFSALKDQFAGIVGYPLENGNVKLAAGWLIESCGWKGYRRGDAGCHEKQALVLVNYGQAKGKDIFGLSEDILQSVYKKFSVMLEREVNLL
ncbi:MAG: UDP-N-acetylmuramate dehydrogenase [Gemmatimonadaceae bacterium]|nr:UDP-N-acetylmuramate dehydrogenase [Chitinophagaceae bacterium]